MSKIGIIDYGAGNIHSLHNALKFLEVDAKVVASSAELEGIDAMIFPGVGAFGDSMRHLRERGLVEPIREWIGADRPYLGICIGYQVLFESSEEQAGVEGIGVFEGTVKKFEDRGLKVPHMGWNNTVPRDPSDPIWTELAPEPHVYFVHSYFPAPKDESIIAATTEYGETFASAIRKGRLAATQFHPEKSQGVGLQLIRNFITEIA